MARILTPTLRRSLSSLVLPIVIILLSGVRAGAAPPATSQVVSSMPLKAEVVRLDQAAHVISVNVTNQGGQAVLAYALRVEITTDASATLAFVQEVDGFLAADWREKSMVAAGHTRLTRIGLPARLTAITVRTVPVTIVYEDNTAVGDPDVIDRIFARRELERSELTKWRRYFKTALIRVAGGAKLDGQTLNTLDQTQTEARPIKEIADVVAPPLRVQALRDMRSALAEVSQGSRAARIRKDLDVLLEKDQSPEQEKLCSAFFTVFELEYQNATKHSRRSR